MRTSLDEFPYTILAQSLAYEADEHSVAFHMTRSMLQRIFDARGALTRLDCAEISFHVDLDVSEGWDNKDHRYEIVPYTGLNAGRLHTDLTRLDVTLGGIYFRHCVKHEDAHMWTSALITCAELIR